ncbi:MAG: cobalamin-binding protein [Dehalococcoidia bacterium]|nr:cobalamin-binding protein [Dehalococcoidia bacterium]
MTVKDMLGRHVVLERKPVRLVSLAPSNTEILFAIGLGDSVVGVTQYCDFPEEAKSKPKIGGFSTADVEKIVSLSPDLVMATRIHEKEVIPALERVGLKVFGLNPRTVDEVLDSIMLTGRVTGQLPVAERLVGELRARIKAVVSRTDNLPQDRRPRVLYINWPDPIKTAGKDTFADDLIKKAGGTNVAGDLTGYSNISLESIVARNPQVIIVSGMGETRRRTYNAIVSETRLGGVEARVKGMVYEIDSPIIERPGPRLILALEQVAKYLHPEVFGKS